MITNVVLFFAVMFGLCTVGTDKVTNKKVYGLVFTILMSLLVILQVGPINGI